MSFFVTSVSPENGGNLGGLAGADAHCQKLAAAVGSGDRTWRAYLSSPASGGRSLIHARDRIGTGPWINSKGERVARSLADLHSENNALGIVTSLNEKGELLARSRHDIMTGSNADGTLATSAGDTTCQAWTSNGRGRAIVGHHDKSGGGDNPTSWNSAHLSEGCSQKELEATLGDALIYCFAAR